MILEVLIDVLVSLLISAASAVSGIFTIPFDLINVLATITGYGSFIVGSDLLLIFFSMLLFWMSFKIILGLVVFIWRLLPLT